MNENMVIAIDALKYAMINDYITWQNVTFEKRTEIHARELDRYINGLSVKVGKKYIKILSGGSVSAFIVNIDNDDKFQYGDILKPASWAIPARNKARGNVFGDYQIKWTGPNYL